MSLMDTLKQSDPEIAKEIDLELNRQRTKLELIASENIVSKAVMEAQGSVLTNKYAEGYPGKRYYGGCEYVDVVEALAGAAGHRPCEEALRRSLCQRPAAFRRTGQHGCVLLPLDAG